MMTKGVNDLNDFLADQRTEKGNPGLGFHDQDTSGDTKFVPATAPKVAEDSKTKAAEDSKTEALTSKFKSKLGLIIYDV